MDFALLKINRAAQVGVHATKYVLFRGPGAEHYRSVHLLKCSHESCSGKSLFGIAISVAIEHVAHEGFVRDVLGNRDGVGELGNRRGFTRAQSNW